jgi:hypothetical protein
MPGVEAASVGRDAGAREAYIQQALDVNISFGEGSANRKRCHGDSRKITYTMREARQRA